MLAGNSCLDQQVSIAPWRLPVVLLVLVLLLGAYRHWRSSPEEGRRAVSDFGVLVDQRGFVHLAEPTARYALQPDRSEPAMGPPVTSLAGAHTRAESTDD